MHLLPIALMVCLACECQSQRASEQTGAGLALTPSPASLTIYPGTSGTTTITATNFSQFSSNVEFNVTSQLPSGVSAMLTSNPDGPVQLTFIAAKDAQPGSVMVTIAAASGSFTAMTTIALSVNEPTYVLSISPIPFTISRGSSFASTVTVVPWGNFTGTVNLSGGQLPPGVSTNFSPTSTNSTSLLTWTADDSAPAGNSTATIAGNAAGIMSYSQFKQFVTAESVPSFTVGVSPAYVTITQGGAASANLAIVESNGFKGEVNLSMTQLPNGITATLSPDAAGRKCVLNLSASDSAAAGVYVTSVWGSAASQSALSPLYLTVQPAPAFTLSVSPSALTLAQGGSDSATIAVSPQSDSTGNVRLSIASLLPVGMNASLTPQPGTSGTLLTLATTSSVTPGEYFLNLSGTSGLQTITRTFPFVVEKATTAANPAPDIESMSPAFAPAAHAAFTLTLTGSGFSQGSTVLWGTSSLATQFVNSTTVTAQVPASKLTSAGAFAITVKTPAPGGGVSNTMQFEVDSAPSGMLGSPVFTPTTALISAGQTATYQVTFPTKAAIVSAACMNLPSGATCTYVSTSHRLNIQTAATSPKGMYQVTVIFSETLPSSTNGDFVLFLFVLPYSFRRYCPTPRHKILAWSIALGLVLSAICAGGCGGRASAPQSSPVSDSAQQLTNSGLVSLTIR